jgi:Protein of unknown function (DUF2938)
LRGKFRHTDILQTPPLRGELVLGLAAHYLIGIVLTLVYLGLLVVAYFESLRNKHMIHDEKFICSVHSWCGA